MFDVYFWPDPDIGINVYNLIFDIVVLGFVLLVFISSCVLIYRRLELTRTAPAIALYYLPSSILLFGGFVAYFDYTERFILSDQLHNYNNHLLETYSISVSAVLFYLAIVVNIIITYLTSFWFWVIFIIQFSITWFSGVAFFYYMDNMGMQVMSWREANVHGSFEWFVVIGILIFVFAAIPKSLAMSVKYENSIFAKRRGISDDAYENDDDLRWGLAFFISKGVKLLGVIMALLLLLQLLSLLINSGPTHPWLMLLSGVVFVLSIFVEIPKPQFKRGDDDYESPELLD